MRTDIKNFVGCFLKHIIKFTLVAQFTWDSRSRKQGEGDKVTEIVSEKQAFWYKGQFGLFTSFNSAQTWQVERPHSLLWCKSRTIPIDQGTEKLSQTEVWNYLKYAYRPATEALKSLLLTPFTWLFYLKHTKTRTEFGRNLSLIKK